jgi:hypothetical protein
MKLGLHGRFHFEAVNVNTGARRELVPWMDNLIVDAGLNRLGIGVPFSHCMVGSGSAVPNVAQTQLTTHVATTASFAPSGQPPGAVDLVNNFAYVRRTWRFTPGQADGNLSEVGVGWATNTCFSRALIVDGLGDPTTITVLEDEYLDVTYEFRVYWPTADITATVTIDGDPYDTIIRPSLVGSWGSPLQNFLALQGIQFVGSGLANDGATIAYRDGTLGGFGNNTVMPDGVAMDTGIAVSNDGSYVNNSNERKCKVVMTPFGNVIQPITGLFIPTPVGYFKCFFDPEIPKDNTDTLTINFTLSWTRKTLP